MCYKIKNPERGELLASGGFVELNDEYLIRLETPTSEENHKEPFPYGSTKYVHVRDCPNCEVTKLLDKVIGNWRNRAPMLLLISYLIGSGCPDSHGLGGIYRDAHPNNAEWLERVESGEYPAYWVPASIHFDPMISLSSYREELLPPKTCVWCGGLLEKHRLPHINGAFHIDDVRREWNPPFAWVCPVCEPRDAHHRCGEDDIDALMDQKLEELAGVGEKIG